MPTAPTPPYSVSELHLPLTPTERNNILSWLHSIGDTTSNNASDSDLLTAYEAEINALHLDPNNPSQPNQSYGKSPFDVLINGPLDTADAIKKLLNWVSDPIRMGELVIGIIVVGVGVNALLRQGLGSQGIRSSNISGTNTKIPQIGNPLTPMRKIGSKYPRAAGAATKVAEVTK